MADLGPAAASPENAFAEVLFEDLPGRYDSLAEVLSFGQNNRWRHELVLHVVRSQPERILDVVCKCHRNNRVRMDEHQRVS